MHASCSRRALAHQLYSASVPGKAGASGLVIETQPNLEFSAAKEEKYAIDKSRLSTRILTHQKKKEGIQQRSLVVFPFSQFYLSHIYRENAYIVYVSIVVTDTPKGKFHRKMMGGENRERDSGGKESALQLERLFRVTAEKLVFFFYTLSGSENLDAYST